MPNQHTEIVKHKEKGTAETTQKRIIVLMYHGTPKDKPSSKYSIKAVTFSRHINYLKRSGWRTATFKELLHQNTIPDKTVILTFDDGYADNYEGAFRVLLDYSMTATWFIVSGYIGKHALWRGVASNETKILTKLQLREMLSYGMEIASHTYSHPDLAMLTYNDQLIELSRSKVELEEVVNETITSFAYPFGKYNQDTIRAVSDTGYGIACSVISGRFSLSSNPYLIPRITIFDNDSVSTLARKLKFFDNDVSYRKIIRYYLRRLESRVVGK